MGTPRSGEVTSGDLEGVRSSVGAGEQEPSEVDQDVRVTLFDGVPVWLFRLGPDGTFIEINGTAVTGLGYDHKSELVGKSAYALLADSQPRSLPLLSGAAREGELELVKNDGDRCWVRVTVERVRDRSGSLVHIEGVAIDITGRRKAEQQASIRDELLDQVPSAVIVTDMDGQCLLWNKHAETMYGWAADEVVGTRIDELIVPEEARSSRLEIAETIKQGERWEGEFTVRRRDGTVLPAQLSASLLYDDRGGPIGVVGVSLDLTESRSAARELRRYQELATAAYDKSSVAKAMISLADGRLVFANQALGDLLGYDKDDLVGRSLAELTHPEDLDRNRSEFQRMLDGETDGYTIDERYICRDESVIWGRLQVSLIRSEDAPRYALGQVVDITERKKAEDRVEFHASLLHQMRTPVIAVDVRGAVTHWNHQAELDYGWTADEAVGRDVRHLILAGLGSRELDKMRESFREHGFWEGETVITRKEGSTFPAWLSGALVRDGDGRAAGVVGAIVDLTDVQNARAEARAREMLSRSLLEAVSVPIAVLSKDGERVASNPAWSASMESSTHRYLPDHVPENGLDPELLYELVAGIDRVIAGVRDRFAIEYSYTSPEGERWIRVVATQVDVGGAIVSHWDISDERFARVALERTIRAKDEFITAISHELRTPLSVVVGLAEALRTGRYAAGETHEFHDLIADQAQEMALIVEDLLVAGRIDSDTLTVRQAMVELEDEIEAVLRPWEQKDEIGIHVKIRSGAAKVYADALRVRQILRNLVTNAARYGAPPVEVKAVRARDKVIVAVSDHGDGVPMDALEKMFQPYARFGGPEAQPSSVGLGLHVARRLARLMGGDLMYKREDGLTTFLLHLPAESPDDSPRGADAMRFIHT